MNLDEILNQFVIDTKIKEYGDGHINDTYLSESQEYILQRINTEIFKDPVKLMDNISAVTQFLKERIIEAGGNAERETLTVINTRKGEKFFTAPDGRAFRVYRFIKKSKTISTVTDPKQMYYAAKGFGRFAKMLNDYPAAELNETIPDFHNTPVRYEALKTAIREDRAGRAKFVQKEIEFALAGEKYTDVVTKELACGNLPTRVTHNDTKINNVLFDEVTGEPVCVIDLDTVMPGSLLYDFGDALRIGAATAAEDERNLENVWFDMQAFKNFAIGYFEEMGDAITQREIELLPFSAKLLTYECGMRFLTDYLNGDTYFKVHREGHNLDRARTQFKLVSDIENKEAEMQWIIRDIKK